MASKQAVITSTSLISNKSLTHEARVGRNICENVERVLGMYPEALQLSVKYNADLITMAMSRTTSTKLIEDEIHSLEPIIIIGAPEKERFRIKLKKEKKLTRPPPKKP